MWYVGLPLPLLPTWCVLTFLSPFAHPFPPPPPPPPSPTRSQPSSRQLWKTREFPLRAAWPSSISHLVMRTMSHQDSPYLLDRVHTCMCLVVELIIRILIGLQSIYCLELGLHTSHSHHTHTTHTHTHPHTHTHSSHTHTLTHSTTHTVLQ